MTFEIPESSVLACSEKILNLKPMHPTVRHKVRVATVTRQQPCSGSAKRAEVTTVPCRHALPDKD